MMKLLNQYTNNDDRHKKKIFQALSVVFTVIFITACCSISLSEKEQIAELHHLSPPQNHFEKIRGDSLHPAAYFTCGKGIHTCSPASKQVNHSKSNKYKHKHLNYKGENSEKFIY